MMEIFKIRCRTPPPLNGPNFHPFFTPFISFAIEFYLYETDFTAIHLILNGNLGCLLWTSPKDLASHVSFYPAREDPSFRCASCAWSDEEIQTFFICLIGKGSAHARGDDPDTSSRLEGQWCWTAPALKSLAGRQDSLWLGAAAAVRGKAPPEIRSQPAVEMMLVV